MTTPEVYSGPIATSGAGNVTAIAAQVGKFFSRGDVWNDSGSPAGQYSLDGGTSWVNFGAGPFSVTLPGGSYSSGVLIRRARGSDNGASESDVTSVNVKLQ